MACACAQQQGVERRAEKNVVGLLTELNENNVAIVKEQKELREELVKALNTGFAGITTMLAASANDTRKAQAQAQASSGQDPLLSEQIYWLALDQAVAPTNEPALKLNFVGIGFEAYFNPLFPSFFKCTYTDAKKNKVGARGNGLPRRPHTQRMWPGLVACGVACCGSA